MRCSIFIIYLNRYYRLQALLDPEGGLFGASGVVVEKPISVFYQLLAHTNSVDKPVRALASDLLAGSQDRRGVSASQNMDRSSSQKRSSEADATADFLCEGGGQLLQNLPYPKRAGISLTAKRRGTLMGEARDALPQRLREELEKDMKKLEGCENIENVV